MSIFGNEQINSQNCRHVMILVEQELKSNQLGLKMVMYFKPELRVETGVFTRKFPV
jgi:hypothetical protein